MAKKKMDGSIEPMGGKSFKPDTSKFKTLVVGEEFTGIFTGAGTIRIKDKRTRQMKDLFVLRLRDPETDRVEKLPCAAMMLRAWEDICDEYGNGDHETTIQALRNRRMTISRGEDTRTVDANPMGNYEFVIFDE